MNEILCSNFGFIEIDSVKYAEDYEVSLQKKIVD